MTRSDTVGTAQNSEAYLQPAPSLQYSVLPDDSSHHEYNRLVLMSDTLPCLAPQGQHHHTFDRDSITDLNENDVLMGRGVNTQYAGNVRFRRVVQSFKDAYAVAPRYRGKQAIAQLIYNEVCQQRQGRFLVECSAPCQDQCWTIVPASTALVKIMQTLRDKKRAALKISPIIGNIMAPWAVVDTPLIAAVTASTSRVNQAASAQIDSRGLDALSSDACHWDLFSSSDTVKDASFLGSFHEVVDDHSWVELALSTGALPTKATNQAVPTSRNDTQVHSHACASIHIPGIEQYHARDPFPSLAPPIRSSPLLGPFHHVKFTNSIPRTASSLHETDRTLTLRGPNDKGAFQFDRHGKFYGHSSVYGVFPNTW